MELTHGNNYNRIEVLAPAGSLEICKAVINAGADAVYLGGDMFGARAYAGNLNNEEMLEALDYAHRAGCRIYLTVNTLLKHKEIEGQLISYIRPFYEHGLDAVIVQDLGVMWLIKKHFPDMDIHASTQMTQTGSLGAKLLWDMGAERVVTSREMTLTEIAQLHNDCPDMEIESFVHGAMCYCYSGQCLMSSFRGGRSGNRGRCAQPCRLSYKVYDNDSQINDKDNSFALSPKDMCALSILPDIIEAGVYSLKIEGRMKNVTYAAYVTSIYRHYVDEYIKYGRKGYKITKKDIDNLCDIYNRGSFIEVANDIASEHLEIVTKDPFNVMTKIKNAGAIFLGEYSSEPLGDYFAGPNHVLPTNGTAKFFSPLSVDDFIKKSSIISYSREALELIHNDIETFAKAEHLTAHANSIHVRFEGDK